MREQDFKFKILSWAAVLLPNVLCLRWAFASGLSIANGLPSGGALDTTNGRGASLVKRPTAQTPRESARSAGVQPKVTGNQNFLNQFRRFRQKLYPAGPSLDAQIDDAIRQNSPLLSPIEKRAKWLPVECKVMGIVLGERRSIVDEGPGKNAVFKVTDAKNHRKQYAHKLFGKPEDYTAELSFFMLADHPRIVRPICIQREFRKAKSGSSAGKGRAGILMEFIPGTSSLDVAKNPTTTPAKLKTMTAQLLDVLKYVHRLGFVHADLKPDNVLVKPNGDIVLIDFGFAVPLPHQHPARGNPNIKAPELNGLVHGVLHEALDMWSWTATIAIWHAYLYLPPHRRSGKKYAFLYNGRSSSPWKIGAVPSKFPEDLRALLYLGTALEVDRRRFQHQATYQFLQQMRFFSSVDWGNL